MTTFKKNSTAAKRAIQEMGASLFYAKVRGEDIGIYEKLASEVNDSDKENLAGNLSLSSNENLNSEVKNVGDDNLTGKEDLADNVNVAISLNKKISYTSPLLTFIAEIGLSGVCMAIVLRHLLPAEGGKIRIGALSRSLHMSSNNIRLHLETLQAKGIIASSSGDQNGRTIKFLHPFLRSQQCVELFVGR